MDQDVNMSSTSGLLGKSTVDTVIHPSTFYFSLEQIAVHICTRLVKHHILQLTSKLFRQFCTLFLVLPGNKQLQCEYVSIYVTRSLIPQTFSQKRPSVCLCMHPQGGGVEVERESGELE